MRFESRRAPAKLRRHLRNPLLVPSVLAGLAALVLGLLWLQSGRTRQSLQSQVATAAGRIATLEAGMAATEASRATTRRVAGFDSAPATGAGAAVLTTHRSRLASVVSVGPSSALVVINYGASHGALPEQRLFIRRGTETLATVHISDVRENFSIAQVRPDTLQAALHKGDSAVLTD